MCVCVCVWNFSPTSALLLSCVSMNRTRRWTLRCRRRASWTGPGRWCTSTSWTWRPRRWSTRCDSTTPWCRSLSSLSSLLSLSSPPSLSSLPKHRAPRPGQQFSQVLLERVPHAAVCHQLVRARQSRGLGAASTFGLPARLHLPFFFRRRRRRWRRSRRGRRRRGRGAGVRGRDWRICPDAAAGPGRAG